MLTSLTLQVHHLIISTDRSKYKSPLPKTDSSSFCISLSLASPNSWSLNEKSTKLHQHQPLTKTVTTRRTSTPLTILTIPILSTTIHAQMHELHISLIKTTHVLSLRITNLRKSHQHLTYRYLPCPRIQRQLVRSF